MRGIRANGNWIDYKMFNHPSMLVIVCSFSSVMLIAGMIATDLVIITL